MSGVVSLASAVSNSSSEDEGGNKSDEENSQSDSSDTASFEDGSSEDSNSDSESSSSSGESGSSGSQSSEESESSSEESEEEIFVDPASAWLTYSEPGDDEVFPEAKPNFIKKIKKSKHVKRKSRNRTKSNESEEEYYSDEKEEYSLEDDEDLGSEEEEGHLNQSMNLEDMSVGDLESALVTKLKSEIGGDDSGKAEEAVNRMLASIKDDLLGNNAPREKRKSSHKGMPEDFYDWAKRAATKVMTKDSADKTPGVSEEPRDPEPPDGTDEETCFNWKKYAKKNTVEAPQQDNGADEPQVPSMEAESEPSESAPEETPTSGQPEAPPVTPPEVQPEPAPEAVSEAVSEAAPEEDRNDEDNETNAVDPGAPDRDSSAEVGSPEAKAVGDQEGEVDLTPYDDDLVERWTLRPRSDDPEVRVFNWKGFTRSRRVSTGAPKSPTFDWKRHAKEQRKLAKKKAKVGSGACPEEVAAFNDEKKLDEVSIEQQGEDPPPPPPPDDILIDNGVDLLKKLIISSDDTTRGAILKQYLAPPPSPEETQGHVSPEDLLKAIAKFVETIRHIKQSDNIPEVTSARQVAIVARLAIIHHYGDGSETLKAFERGLAPAFAPKAAAAVPAAATTATPTES